VLRKLSATHGQEVHGKPSRNKEVASGWLRNSYLSLTKYLETLPTKRIRRVHAIIPAFFEFSKQPLMLSVFTIPGVRKGTAHPRATVPLTFLYAFAPQHFLNFLPLPHGHGSLRPTFFSLRTVPDFFCSR